MRTLAPAVASLAAAALVLIPTAASAERWTHHDAKGDVMQADYDPETDKGTFTNVPDLTRATNWTPMGLRRADLQLR